MTPAVELRQLRFGYRPGTPVLQVDSLVVPAGESVFLHGPSGSGKTTLLGIIAGVLKADRGEALVLGNDLTRLGGSDRDHLRGERLGYIFQMFNLIPYLSAFDNITLPCRMNSRRMKRLDGSLDVETRALARTLEIESLLGARPGELSVGQQQRVAAARALLGRPDLVVADEPTSALDADRREAFLGLLFESCREAGATLLFVSHDRSLESRFDRALSLPDVNRAPVAA
ncbi:MAG: ABC transporter ATP-binding protein [Gemmatimonadales bacterium]|nr:MAG: ABC transporter ATP-binding protein [Gemmatimonadales bacterium]